MKPLSKEMVDMIPDHQMWRSGARDRVILDWSKRVAKLEARLNEYGTLKEAFTMSIHLLNHADFKNGNTGPNGVIDEGEVHASRLMDKIKALVPQLYANILEGK